MEKKDFYSYIVAFIIVGIVGVGSVMFYQYTVGFESKKAYALYAIFPAILGGIWGLFVWYDGKWEKKINAKLDSKRFDDHVVAESQYKEEILATYEKLEDHLLNMPNLIANMINNSKK